MKTRARRAFSLVELMTVVGIIALLISLLLPALSRARENGRRIVCLANLRSIAQGCIGYAVDNEGHVPEWGQKVAGFRAIGQAWDWDGVVGSPNAPAVGTVVTSNTRNVWMLVHGQAGDPKTFICPSDDEAGEAFVPGDMTHVYDVQNRSQFSYSFQYQGPGQVYGQIALNAANARDGWNTTMVADPNLVIAADATPCMSAVNRTVTDTGVTGAHLFNIVIGVPADSVLQAFVNAMKPPLGMATPARINYNTATGKGEFTIPSQTMLQALNSANHRSEGQNVVRLEGSGEFSAHPWAGANLDNIYTVQDPSVYTALNLLATGNPAYTDMLRGRMVGLYEGYVAYGTPAFTYTEVDIMQAWVFDRTSKTRFPDSFLVP